MNTVLNFRIIISRPNILHKLLRKKKQASTPSLIDLLRQTTDRLRPLCSNSTHKNRVTAVNNFEKYLLQASRNDSPITVRNITAADVKAYELWAFEQGFNEGYISLNMRSLRVLFNHINNSGTELFKLVRTSNCQTKKRAVSEDTIKQIRQLKLQEGTNLELARDIFLFCFHGMGIPLIDAIQLKKSQLKGNEITYHRQKTKRMVTITVNEELKDILNHLAPKDSPYLLPVLTTEDRTEARRQYKRFYQRYMRALAKLETMLDADCHLTSYTPRHSWASIAYSRGVDINIIAQALGHANSNITYLYIKEINNFLLKKANDIVTKAVM